jgi:hypothetical protein
MMLIELDFNSFLSLAVKLCQNTLSVPTLSIPHMSQQSKGSQKKFHWCKQAKVLQIVEKKI